LFKGRGQQVPPLLGGGGMLKISLRWGDGLNRWVSSYNYSCDNGGKGQNNEEIVKGDGGPVGEPVLGTQEHWIPLKKTKKGIDGKRGGGGRTISKDTGGINSFNEKNR